MDALDFHDMGERMRHSEMTAVGSSMPSKMEHGTDKDQGVEASLQDLVSARVPSATMPGDTGETGVQEQVTAQMVRRDTVDIHETDETDKRKRKCSSLRAQASDAVATYTSAWDRVAQHCPSGYPAVISGAEAQEKAKCVGLKDSEAKICKENIWKPLESLIRHVSIAQKETNPYFIIAEERVDALKKRCHETWTVPHPEVTVPAFLQATKSDCDQKWNQASVASDRAALSASSLFDWASMKSFTAWMEANQRATMALRSASSIVQAAATMTLALPLPEANKALQKTSSSAFEAYNSTTSSLQNSAVSVSMWVFDRASSLSLQKFSEASKLYSDALHCDAQQNTAATSSSNIKSSLNGNVIAGSSPGPTASAINARDEDRDGCVALDELLPFFPNSGTSGQIFSVTGTQNGKVFSALMTVTACETSAAIGTFYDSSGSTEAMYAEEVANSSIEGWLDNGNCFTAAATGAVPAVQTTILTGVNSPLSSSATLPTLVQSSDPDIQTRLTTITAEDIPFSTPGVVHVTVTRTLTSTQYVPEPWESHGSVFTTTETILDLGSTILRFMGPTQTYGNSTFITAPAATLYPINARCQIGILQAMSDQVASMSDIDFNPLQSPASLTDSGQHDPTDLAYLLLVAEHLRTQDASMALPLALKYARLCMRQEVTNVAMMQSICTHRGCTKDYNNCSISISRQTALERRDQTTLISAPGLPSPCVGKDCTALVAKPAPSPLICYDPFLHGLDTPNCNSTRTDKKACKIDRCLWQHLQPMNFTTVQQGMMAVRETIGSQTSLVTLFDFFTYSTSVSGRPHWGITDGKKRYGPMYITSSLDPVPKTSAVPVLPSSSSKHFGLRNIFLLGGSNDKQSKWTTPSCFDENSCYDLCLKEHEHKTPWKKILMYIGAAIVALALLGALALALAHCMRRRRDRRLAAIPAPGHRDSGVDFLPPPPMEQRVGTMPPATGMGPGRETGNASGGDATASGGAGNATAGGNAGGNERVVVVPGAGAGSTAGGDGTNAEGRGTAARRAEEGRGRVRFPDGGNAGTAGPEKLETTSTPAPATGPTGTERVEVVSVPPTQPAHVQNVEALPVPGQHVDGAVDLRTGSEVVDMGSMRGRKRNRPSMQNLLH